MNKISRLPQMLVLSTHAFALVVAIAWSGIAAAQTPDSTSARTAAEAANACPAIWQYSFNKLQDDTPQVMCQYAGKVALVVNTASYCGFTAQYEGLEKLYAQYKDRGLVVLGFPSNDFGKQEPGNSKEIADFCYNTYGVVFPMFSKSTFTGPDANPLFTELTRATGSKPGWNFHKYLIDRSGKVVGAYPSIVAPGDKKLVSEIERLLAIR